MADGRETSGWVVEDDRPHCGSCGSLMHFDEGLFCPNSGCVKAVAEAANRWAGRHADLLAERDRLRELLRRGYNGVVTGVGHAKDAWLRDVRNAGVVDDLMAVPHDMGDRPKGFNMGLNADSKTSAEST